MLPRARSYSPLPICLSVAQFSYQLPRRGEEARRAMLWRSFGARRLIGVVSLLWLSLQLFSCDKLASGAAEAATGAGGGGSGGVGRPLAAVSARYWARNLEFSERDNWRAQRKPCTLAERILVVEEAAVVSLGDALVALAGPTLESGSIRDLALAQTGALLLEEDTLVAGEPLDPLFVRYLNESDECQEARGQGAFILEVEKDSLSWFNPANWASSPSADSHTEQLMRLLPEACQVPCSESVVTFGDRRLAFWPILMGEERSHDPLPFKVSFRAAEGVSLLTPPIGAPLRVSKLKIGERAYSQAEFEQLNALYANQLFTFQDELSMLSAGRQHQVAPSDLLLIDDSSIHQKAPEEEASEDELCLDEAGCQCGNQRPEVMAAICSFNEPLLLEQQPCRDPIQVTGYCNSICATLLSISMEPSKFKEALLLEELMQLSGNHSASTFSGSVNDPQAPLHLLHPWRVEHDRYELVLRQQVSDNPTQEFEWRQQLDLAEQIKQALNRPATKSFYGIRSVSIRASVDWRCDNRTTIMWATFAISCSIFILAFVYNDQLFPIYPLASLWKLIESSGWLVTSEPCGARPGSLDEPIILDQDLAAVGDMSIGTVVPKTLTEVEIVGLALVQLDSISSVSNSTQSLISPEDI